MAGSILSCFLGHDGGPREGAIKLQPEKSTVHPSTIPEEAPVSPSLPFVEEEEPHGLAKIQKKLSRRFSDIFFQRGSTRSDSPMNLSQPAVPLASPPARTDRGRSFSRTRMSRTNGSAYGYSGSYRNRVASNITFDPRRPSFSNSMRRRRGSNYDGTRDSPADGSDLNFAQRLLLANENAVTNIADLWVAAAMNVDNEDPFENDSDIEDDDVNSLDLGDPFPRTETVNSDNDALSGFPFGRSRTFPRTDTMNSDNDAPSGSPFGRSRVAANIGASFPRTDTMNSDNDALSGSPFGRSRVAANIGPSFPRTNTINSTHPSLPVPSLRHSLGSHRPSVSFMAPYAPRRMSNNVPSIFAHPGVKTPPAVLDAQQLLNPDVEQPDVLHTIAESRQASQDDVEPLNEKPPSLISQLPIIIIIQYGVMALHTTTHDQIFMSYLVS